MIRLATEGDIAEILDIERASISPPWSHGVLLSEIYSEDSFFALSIGADGAILGFVILRRMVDEAELFQIAVDEAHRRRGVASALMGAGLAWANDNGINSIYLEARISNGAAIALYEKHGFTRTGRRKGYYTDPIEDAVIMARQSSVLNCFT